MRICFWSEYFWPHPGGTESFLAQLCPALRDRGHEIMILTSALQPGAGRESFRGMELHRLPFRQALQQRSPEGLLQLKKQLRKSLDDFEPDLIHLHTIGSADFFLRSLAPPYCVSIHQEIDPLHFPASGRETLQRSRGIVACSRFAHAELAALGMAPKTRLIYHGLDRPALEPDPLPWPPHLGVVGRMLPFKGFDLALQAFAHLVDHCPEARLTLVGDGPERAALERLAEELGIAVEFAGWVAGPDIYAQLNQFTLVMMPSRWEGLGLVALEAMQMARPLVACSSGGLVEVVEHGLTGLLVPPTAEAVAQAALQLLSDRERARRLGERARTSVQARFGLDRCCREHEEFYAACLSS